MDDRFARTGSCRHRAGPRPVLHGIVGEQPRDREAFFAESIHHWAVQIGIAPGRIGPGARKPRQLREPVGTGETNATAQVIEITSVIPRKKWAHDTPSPRNRGNRPAPRPQVRPAPDPHDHGHRDVLRDVACTDHRPARIHTTLASAWLTSFAIGVAVAIPTAILVAPGAQRLASGLTGAPRRSPPDKHR